MTEINLSPQAEIVTNEAGGKQSDTGTAFHYADPLAMLALAKVLDYGAKRYDRDNWRLIEEEEHINHAITHLFAYMAGDEQDDHLEHALCRVHMALARKLRPSYLGHAEAKPNGR